MTIPEDIDDAFAAFEKLAKSFEDALTELETEQARGRSGIAHYRKAAYLQNQVNTFAAKLAAQIDEVRRSL